MPKWAAIIIGMAGIIGITGITANVIPRSPLDPHCPAAIVDAGRPAPMARAGTAAIIEMRIPFCPRTF
jgi:hypothetical protein